MAIDIDNDLLTVEAWPLADPHGNYGAYIRRLDDMGSNDNDGYIDELRQLSKQKLQLEGYQRVSIYPWYGFSLAHPIVEQRV